MQVNKDNIAQYMTANNVTFLVPVYQRNYDWSEKNCAQLWDDIVYVSQGSESRTHFLGTICSKSMNAHEKTIIDGQQRITTITLLMKAMHDCTDSEGLKADIANTYLLNTGYGVPPERRVKLHLNRRDDAIYNKLLESRNPLDGDNFTDDDIDSSIYQNYRFFCGRLEGLEEGELAAIKEALDRMVIVDLDVESENPQEIFESLNSTGLDLTDVDLLRNYLLMSLDYQTQLHLYDEYWYPIERNVGTGANMVRFFIDFFIYTKASDAIMVNGRRAHVNKGNLYVTYKQHYETLRERTGERASSPEVTERLLSDMYERSKIYRRLVFPAGTDPSQLDPISRTIHSIVVLNEAESARPLLMYVMEALAAGTITEAQALEMLNACLSLVFRAKVTKSTGINGQFAGNVLQRLRRQSQDNEVERFWKAITAGSGRFAFPSDELFRSSLIDRPIFDVLRAKGTKYLFYELERQTMASKGLPSYNDVNITTEHVMPQRLSEAWRDELGDEAEHHDEYLNRIGNLTLTSNNPEMSNKPFEEKKAWYAESSFHLTRQLGKVDGWSIGRIRKRSSQLADACVETWAFPKQYQSGTDPVEHAGKRRPNFQFSFVDLEPGDEVALLENPSKVAVVIDDRHVGYHGMTYTLTGLAKKLLHTDAALSGPEHFTYDGEKLSEMRDRIESNLL